MTAGTFVATTHGPLNDAAENQTPFWHANHEFSSTLMIGVPLLGAEPVPFPNVAPNAPQPSGRPPGRGGLGAPGLPSLPSVPANPP